MREVVLIADDDADAIELLSLFLAREGYLVEAVTGGAEALLRLERDPGRYACVITDWSMGYPDGYDVAQRLRTDPKFRGVKILLMTGGGKHLQERFEGLVDLYLLKPVHPDEFLKAVHAVIGPPRDSTPKLPLDNFGSYG